jgi:hypothetical protein
MRIAQPPAAFPNLKQLHARKCFLLGVTEPWKVEALWREEVERRKAKGAEDARR